MCNGNRSKSNKVIRDFLDRFIGSLPNGTLIQPVSICTLVNEEDHRRGYSTSAISGLLREREDVIREKNGWKKVGITGRTLERVQPGGNRGLGHGSDPRIPA